MNGPVRLVSVGQPGQLLDPETGLLLAELGPVVAGLVVGSLLVAARPALADGAATEIRTNPVATFLTGTFALLGVVLGLVGASLVFGAPSELLGRAGLGVLGVLGIPLGAYAVGTALTDRVGVANRWLALAVGFAGVGLLSGIVSSLPVPSVGLSALTPSTELLLVGAPGLGVLVERASQRVRGAGGGPATTTGADGNRQH